MVDDEEDVELLDPPLVPGILAGLLFTWLTMLYCDWVTGIAGSVNEWLAGDSSVGPISGLLLFFGVFVVCLED